MDNSPGAETLETLLKNCRLALANSKSEEQNFRQKIQTWRNRDWFELKDFEQIGKKYFKRIFFFILFYIIASNFGISICESECFGIAWLSFQSKSFRRICNLWSSCDVMCHLVLVEQLRGYYGTQKLSILIIILFFSCV